MTGASIGSVVAEGPVLFALPIAVLAGLVSFLSPCCLPLVPGYLAYIGGAAGADAALESEGRERSILVTGTVLFVLGFAAVFVSYGAFFGAMGATLIRYQDPILRLMGILTIVLGLLFAGLLQGVPGLSRTLRLGHRPRLGVAGAPMLGVMFGIGWTPCIGPTLAAVLSLATASATAGRGAFLSLAYSVGLGMPFLLASLGLRRVFTLFAFARRHAPAVMRTGGAMLVILGILEATGVWGELMAQMRTLIGAWQPPV